MSDDFSIQVAPRVHRLPPYLFGQINRLKHEKRVAGVDIIDLAMGNPNDPPPPMVVDKLCEAARDPRNSRYSDSAGIFNFRREMARKYEARWGVSLDPETEIIATIGSKEGFSHLCLAMMGPGDTAIVPEPAFPIHVYAPALAGANVISIPLGTDHAFLDRVAHMIENLFPRPKLLVLNYPHNPTAATVEPGFFEEVVDLAKRLGVYVIHDFAYGETCFGDYEAPSFLQVKGAKDVGVELTTLSKPYSMAGWRIGFCCGHPEMIQALRTVKGYYDYGMFQALQVAAIIALRHCDEDVRRQAAKYEARRDVLCRGLNRIGLEVEPPRASMFVWARVPEKFLHGTGTIDWAMWLMESAEVAVAPGRAFGPGGEGYVRLALVENELRLKQAIRQIDRAINAKPAKKQRTSRSRRSVERQG